MIGYKGIEYKNGILRAKYSDIFEVGVPKQKVILREGAGFSENGYSFCETMEDVLCYMNYIEKSSIKDIRLFKINTLDNKIKKIENHFKAESLTVMEEVTQKQIINYFELNPKKLHKYISKETWDNYRNSNLQCYERILDEQRIKEIPILNCFYIFQNGFCKQTARSLCLKLCDNCEGKDLRCGIGDNMTDYWYLQCRRKLFGGYGLGCMKEYYHLKVNSIERNNLEYLYNWIMKTTN